MKYKISELVSINSKAIKKDYDGLIKYIDTSSVNNGKFDNPRTYSTLHDAPSRARRMASVGDTVISTVRPNMKHIGFISENNNYVYSTGFAVVSPNRKLVDPYYLYLYLSSAFVTKTLQSIGETSTSTYPSIKPNDIGNLSVDIPSMKEQTVVAKRIRLLDEKIKFNNRINDNLFELAMTEFKRRFSTSGLGKISDYFLPKRGKNLLKKDVIAGNIPVVAGGLHPAAYHNQSNTQFPVITISASGANAGYVQLWGENVWSSDSSYIDKSVTSNAFFWYLVLKSKQKQIFDAQTGSAQPHIYPKHIGNLQVPKYSDEEISKFNSFISPLFNQVFQNNRENRKLSILRDLLLNKYF